MSAARSARRARLTSAGAFRKVFEQPWRSTDRRFSLLARSNDLDYARLGLAISKKSLKTATERNRVKRVVRESFRLHAADVTGFDIVVVGRALVGCDNAELRKSLDQHWIQLARHAHCSDDNTDSDTARV
jgi:ribonuclease P protein component